MVCLLHRNRIWLSVSLVVFVIAVCSATSVLQTDNDLVFEEDQTPNNIFDDLKIPDQSSHGLQSYIHGSLKRIKRSLWSLFGNDDSVIATNEATPTSASSDTVSLSRVTRATDEDEDPSLPITESFSAPKRGDTSIEDDEDDSLTSGDGIPSGDGPIPDDSIRSPAAEKEDNKIEHGPDAIVPKVDSAPQLSFNWNTTAVPPTSSIITTSTTTTTTTTTEATTTTTTTTSTIPTIATNHSTTETQKFNEIESRVDGDQITKIFRVHLTIMEPYNKDYMDMNSEAFKWLANNITLSLEESLKKYGTYSPRVVAIQPRNTDNFFVRATVDVESEGGESKETLEDHFKYFLYKWRTFNPNSPLTIIEEGFDIEEVYAGNTANCQSGETLCVVTNACLPPEYRCNGLAECPDGTDELMCPSSKSVPVPICGNDDFQCDGTRCINKSDVCNGVADCSDQTDEQNCRRITGNYIIFLFDRYR